MKGKLLLLFFCWLLVIRSAWAQAEEVHTSLHNESGKKHIIKTNLLSILTHAASVSYENILTHQFSLQASAYYGKSNVLGGIQRMSIAAQFRKYFPKEDNLLVGMYLAPYLKYQQLTHFEEKINEQHTAEAQINTIGGGIIIGRQWIAKKGFTVDMYAGAGYNPQAKLRSVKVLDPNHRYIFSERRWQKDFMLGLVIGFAF